MPYTPNTWPFNGEPLPGGKEHVPGATYDADGNPVPPKSGISNAEWNDAMEKMTQLGDNLQAGDFHGHRDMSASMPDASSATGVRWANRGGRPVISRGGKAFWDPFTTLNALEYEADPTGSTSSTQALLDAIAAMPRGSSGHNGQILHIPAGDYVIDGRLDFSGIQGFRIVGDGKYATRLLWDGDEGDDFLYFMGSQLWSLEYLTLWGKASAKPAAMIHCRMASGYRFAQYGIRFHDLLLDGQTADEFTDGIRFSTDGAGNNSEVTYDGVEINKALTNAVHLEGAQAKAHRFFECRIVQGVNGILCDATAGHGCPTFSFRSGNVSNCETAFVFGGNGDAMVIEDVQSENCNRFFDMGDSVLDFGQSVCIRNNRIDFANAPSPNGDSIIRLSGAGPFTIEDNSFFGGTEVARIRVSVGGLTSCKIENNRFYSYDSVGTSPLNWNTGNTGPASQVHMRGNTFVNAAGTIHRGRLEGLDCGLPTNFYVASVSGDGNQYALLLDNALWTDAALTQTVALPLPQGVRIKGMTLYRNSGLTLPGNPDVTVKVGETSGGDEYLLSTNVSAGIPQIYDDPALLGANLTTGFRPGGYIPDFFNPTTLYITATSSSGNLGTGSATRMTAGQLFLLLEADISTRWLRVA